jgi:transposase
MAQITVISGVERRRQWSDDQKRAFVEAAIAPGASVAAIAREADVASSSIYRWRREFCGKAMAPRGFSEVAIHPDPIRPDQVGAPDMLVIEIRGATMRVPNGTSASLLVAALRELKA